MMETYYEYENNYRKEQIATTGNFASHIVDSIKKFIGRKKVQIEQLFTLSSRCMLCESEITLQIRKIPNKVKNESISYFCPECSIVTPHTLKIVLSTEEIIE